MQKGAPSVNPLGRAAPIAKAKTAPGHNGARAYGGYVPTGETSRELAGSQKWVTYANAFQFPPIAIAALLRYALTSGAKWSVVENPAGGADAVRGAEIVQAGLLDARLASGDTWAEIAAKAGMAYFNGSSIHAAALGRRADGMVVYTDIAHRPMNTIERWLSPRNVAPFQEVEQRVDGATYAIPLSECLYVVEKMLSDNPFGEGVLRLVAERIRRAGRYEVLEGSELFSSLGGLPIIYVPLEEIVASVAHLPEAEQQAAIDRKVEDFVTTVRDRIKTPEKQMWQMLDSKTYEGPDQKPTNTPKWRLEIVKAQLQGLIEARKVITDLHMDVARVVHVGFAYIGGGDTKGTHSAHSSILDAFLRQLQTGNDRTAVRATQQLGRRLVAANGLDADRAAPTIRVEKLTRASMTEMLESLGLLNAAAPHAKDPVRNLVREHYELPPEPDDVLDDMRAPRAKVTDGEDEDISDVGDDEDDQADKDKERAE